MILDQLHTCLPVMWKPLTSILTKECLRKENLIPDEQKGCTRSSGVSKDQLLIDCTILKDAKARCKNLEMLWVDHAEVYDSVPCI